MDLEILHDYLIESKELLRGARKILLAWKQIPATIRFLHRSFAPFLPSRAAPVSSRLERSSSRDDR